MSHTRKAAQDEDEIEATDDHRRRWYQLRPVPRRRTDLMGFSTTWWVLWWLIFVVLLLYPGPYW
jgi:hypothetical protein